MNKEKIKEIEEFYILNHKKIKDDIYKITKCYRDVEDIVHTVIMKYLKEYRNWHSYEKISYEGFLGKCIIGAMESMEKEGMSAMYHINVLDPLDVIIHEEEKEKIISKICELKYIYKSVLECYYLKNMSIKETAIALKLKRDTVSKRLRRGRIKLAKVLKL